MQEEQTVATDRVSETVDDHPFLNRDLSWLSFNQRVLMEAMDSSVPALERLRFLAIYSSNLDEFFRVRVADIRSLAMVGKKKINRRAGFDPQETLDEIHEEVGRQLTIYGETLNEVLSTLKEKGGLEILTSMEELRAEEIHEVTRFFKTRVLGRLRPEILKKKRRSGFLHNQHLYFAVKLRGIEKKKDQIRFGLVNIPSDKMPRFFPLNRRENDRTVLIFLDEIVRLNIGRVFPGYVVLECCEVKLNKNADLQIADEYSGDLVAKIESQIKKRDLGMPSRFLHDGTASEELLEAMKFSLGLKTSDLVPGGRHHNLDDFWQVENPGKEAGATQGEQLEFETLPPQRHGEIDAHDSLFEAMEKADRLLHFPYQSYDYVLQFFNEAATDPDVREIDVTFYRMAEKSSIGEALISAARNGKKVFVFMELKARFDERNNLQWAQRFEDAGVKIVYSMPGLKVHAKVAQVKKRKKGKESFYGFFGTGNLNEKTARIYSDFGLLTTSRKLNRELAAVFTFLHKREKSEQEFKHLIVSQFNAMEVFLGWIDREIEAARAGKAAGIIVKVNNIEERGLIAKLYEAAEAGVDVTILARSVCCVVPGHKGVRVLRLVGRFLEHARIFYFENSRAGEPAVFLGSSDWMNRNLHRRVEVSFPVYDEELKKRIIAILKMQLHDNVKAVTLNHNLENVPVCGGLNENDDFNSQRETYFFLEKFQSPGK